MISGTAGQKRIWRTCGRPWTASAGAPGAFAALTDEELKVGCVALTAMPQE
jgi:hypothetical protein